MKIAFYVVTAIVIIASLILAIIVKNQFNKSYSEKDKEKVKSKWKKRCGIFGGLSVCLVAVMSILMVTTDNNTEPPNIPSTTPLSVPTMTWDKENECIRWEAIPNAEKYELSVNNETFIVYQKAITLENNGSYRIKIRAISGSTNYSNSQFSKELSFTQSKLAKPQTDSRLSEDKSTAKILFLKDSFSSDIDNITFSLNNKTKTISVSDLSEEYVDDFKSSLGSIPVTIHGDCYYFNLDTSYFGSGWLTITLTSNKNFVKRTTIEMVANIVLD